MPQYSGFSIDLIDVISIFTNYLCYNTPIFVYNLSDLFCLVFINKHSISIEFLKIDNYELVNQGRIFNLNREEITMNLLKIGDASPAIVNPETTVSDAVAIMVEKHVGAVAVAKEEKLVGIFTERDVMLRVILLKKDPEVTKMAEVMTEPVESIAQSTKPVDVLTLMIKRHFRHFPITNDDGSIQGMLSIRNLLEAQIKYLSHELESLEAFMTADGPGG